MSDKERIEALEKKVLELEKSLFEASEEIWDVGVEVSELQLATCMNAMIFPYFCTTVNDLENSESDEHTCIVCDRKIRIGDEIQWMCGFSKGNIGEKPSGVRRPVHFECINDMWREYFSYKKDDCLLEDQRE